MTPAGQRPVTRHIWTADEIRALGATTDVVTAGQILGIGRTTAYQLARTERFPTPILRIGRRYIIPVAALLDVIRSGTKAPSEKDLTIRRTSSAAGV